MKNFTKQANKGFSLVELIVVIAIMAILVGVAVPVYTQYIDKANKSKDIQLVDEIKHAVEIASAADNWVGTYGNGYVGAVILHKDGSTTEVSLGSNSILNGKTTSAGVDPLTGAMNDTFGGLNNIKMSYDGWTRTLDAENAVIIKNSAFNGNTAYLMGDIQALTDAVKAFIGKGTDDSVNALIAEHLDSSQLASLGFDSGNSQHLANAVTLVVAQSTLNYADTLPEQWKFGNLNFPTKDALAGLAASFAMMDAMVCRGCPKLRQDFKIEIDTKNASAILDSLDNIQYSVANHIDGCAECREKLWGVDMDGNDIAGATPYLKSAEAEQDAKAYLALLKQITQAQDRIISDASNEALYAAPALNAYISNYMSVADLVGDKVNDGDVAIAFTMDETGLIFTNAYPIEY